MRTIIFIIFSLFAFQSLEIISFKGQGTNNFVYELSTTKTEFFEGETIPLFMRIKNNSNQKDSIYSLGEFKILHNLYVVKENGDSTTGYQFSWDDGDTYTVFQPGQTIEFYNKDLTTYAPLSGGLFYPYIPIGKYKVRGYIPNGNDIINSNDLELIIMENEGIAKEEFEVIKRLAKVYIEEVAPQKISFKSFEDSIYNLYLSKYENGKFITKAVNYFTLGGYNKDLNIEMNLNAIKKADVSDSSYAILLTGRFLKFLEKYGLTYSFTQNDFKNFLRNDPEIDPAIRQKLIFELERR